MSVVNVSKSDIIDRLSKELKKLNELKAPAWAQFAKTGAHTERPPTNPDWWFVRAASILVKLTELGPVGVSKLRVKYGGKKNRGMAPEKFKKSGGKIIRLQLQQLEKAGFAKQATKGLHKGRIITPKGTSFVEKISYQLMKENNIVLPQKNSAQHTHSAEKNTEEKPAEAQATLTGEIATPIEDQKLKKPRKSKKKVEEPAQEITETKNE